MIKAYQAEILGMPFLFFEVGVYSIRDVNILRRKTSPYTAAIKQVIIAGLFLRGYR